MTELEGGLTFDALQRGKVHARQGSKRVNVPFSFQYFNDPPRSFNTASWLRGCWLTARLLVWGLAEASAQCYEDTHCFYTCGYGYYQHAGMVKVVALSAQLR